MLQKHGSTRGWLISAGDKQSLRDFYRGARRALAGERQAIHARAVADELLPRIASGNTVAAYVARDGEVDLGVLIEACWRRHVGVAIPVLDGRTMRFAEYRLGSPLRDNRFGIVEPVRPVTVIPDLVLVPVVAFDANGRRLGMGGGYYDRYFAAVPTPERVGIAHECQRAARLPANPWDIPLTAVVTEKGWQTFRNHGYYSRKRLEDSTSK